MRFRPELALTRLGIAELLLDHYPAEKKDALEHLDFAIKEFREMKMQPSLERALRCKEILKTHRTDRPLEPEIELRMAEYIKGIGKKGKA